MENKDTTTNNNITNNISIKTNPFTTIFGIVFMLVGIGVIVLPIFYTAKTDIPEWTGWALSGLGLILLFAPDKLINGLGKIVDRKSDTL